MSSLKPWSLGILDSDTIHLFFYYLHGLQKSYYFFFLLLLLVDPFAGDSLCLPAPSPLAEAFAVSFFASFFALVADSLCFFASWWSSTSVPPCSAGVLRFSVVFGVCDFFSFLLSCFACFACCASGSGFGLVGDGSGGAGADLFVPRLPVLA